MTELVGRSTTIAIATATRTPLWEALAEAGFEMSRMSVSERKGEESSFVRACGAEEVTEFGICTCCHRPAGLS